MKIIRSSARRRQARTAARVKWLRFLFAGKSRAFRQSTAFPLSNAAATFCCSNLRESETFRRSEKSATYLKYSSRHKDFFGRI
jgi:hypothetical protein